MNLAKQFSIFVFTFLIGILHACDSLDAQESQKPVAVHSATQAGVTVHLEKVTVDRILNTSAWLNAKEAGSKRGKELAKNLQQHLPARLVRFSISVLGDTKKLGPTKIDFVDGIRTVSSVDRFFSPPKWQPRLRELTVDPKASGIETQHLLAGNTKLSAIFPAQLKVEVTKADGKKLTFVFDNVEF